MRSAKRLVLVCVSALSMLALMIGSASAHTIVNPHGKEHGHGCGLGIAGQTSPRHRTSPVHAKHQKGQHGPPLKSYADYPCPAAPVVTPSEVAPEVSPSAEVPEESPSPEVSPTASESPSPEPSESPSESPSVITLAPAAARSGPPGSSTAGVALGALIFLGIPFLAFGFARRNLRRRLQER
ncbi:MAG TPA: hypothetical protein VF660_06155 [Actinomycetota bacterium]|jgi:hypothetical protein